MSTESVVLVTPTLLVGDTLAEHLGARRVRSAREAIGIIVEGGTAQLPAGAWDQVVEVLRDFGAPEEHIQWTLEQAQRT